MFFDHCLIAHDIPTYVQTDNGTYFVSKLNATIGFLLGVKHLTALVHYPQTNGQAWNFNTTIHVCFRHFFPKHQKYWDTVEQPLMYAYKKYSTDRQTELYSALSLIDTLSNQSFCNPKTRYLPMPRGKHSRKSISST